MARKLILIILGVIGMAIHPFKRERICVYDDDGFAGIAHGNRPISKLWRR